jgi:hypothetical protein
VRYINRLLKQIFRKLSLRIIWSFLILTGIISAALANDVPKIVEVNDQYIVLRTASDDVIPLKSRDDSEGYGIENALEVNGFTYDIINGLQAWSGDSSVTYYKTDPLRRSMDGDPYDDFTEASGNNMPATACPNRKIIPW